MHLTKKAFAVLLSLLTVMTEIFSLTAINVSAETGEEKLEVLLIEDNLPWNSNTNSIMLNQIGASYKKITTAQFNDTNVWDYDMVIVANDQDHDTYQNFKSFKEQLDLFANLGGVIIYGACDSGWAGGSIQTDLPGGIKKQENYSYNNYIVDFDHPIVTASLSDGNGISDSDLYSNYCSHNDFIESSLTGDCNVILKSDSGLPTLIEYSLGAGYIIASTLTWEHNYSNNNYFAGKIMDDLFLYGLSLCNKEDIIISKMLIGTDNNSFLHSSSSFFNESESEKYLITDVHFNKLNSYYEESFIEWLPFTKNQIQKQRDSEWGGSCYGLSVSMALAFTGGIDLTNYVIFDDKEQVYFNAPMPKDDADFRSMINYYQLSQYVPLIDKQSVNAYKDDSDEYMRELQTIVELAKQSEKSGIPFIFTFGYKWNVSGVNGSAGHAIVCIGVEKIGDNYRIQFIDPNNTSGYLYANIDTNYTAINFESIYTAASQKAYNRDNWEITRVGHDTLSAFNVIDIDGDAKMGGRARTMRVSDVNDLDVIVFDSDAEFILTTDSGETLIFDGAEISGTLEILDIQYYEKGDSVDYQLAIASHNNYNITSLRDDLNISIYDNEEYVAVTGNNIDSAQISRAEGVVVEGDSMNCDIFYGGLDGENTEMIKFSNDNTDNIVIKETADALVVAGDNIENTRSVAYVDAQIYDVYAEESDSEELFFNKDNEIVEHSHTEEVIPGKSATCIETGLTEGKKCSVCGEILVAQEEIPATGHKEEVILGKLSTCTETGLAEGKKCSVCNEILVVQEEIPAIGHKEKVIPGKSATCTGKGLTEGKKCSSCGEILVAQKEIAAKGHTPGSWEVSKKAEIGKEGKEVKKCTVCKAVVDERAIAALKEEGKPGDVDGNGKITAADARLALRISAKLEKATEYQTRIADMDKNNKITAADARKILRISAKLE